jgi:hypothetical protein
MKKPQSPQDRRHGSGPCATSAGRRANRRSPSDTLFAPTRFSEHCKSIGQAKPETVPCEPIERRLSVNSESSVAEHAPQALAQRQTAGDVSGGWGDRWASGSCVVDGFDLKCVRRVLPDATGRWRVGRSMPGGCNFSFRRSSSSLLRCVSLSHIRLYRFKMKSLPVSRQPRARARSR